ncbi:hypothetical protein FACS1894188_02920 [Clostridia bacterium]|nr:hypothetical protein FACS1894188_02920 [Clostridia bacterium]
MFKKLATFLITLAALFVYATAIYADDIKLFVNDNEISAEQAVPVRDENGRVLVPVRFVSEQLGANVDWNPEERAVSVSTDVHKVVFVIGQNAYTADDQIFEMDTKAQIINSLTYVPLRVAGESLGATVAWDNDTTTAYISTTPASDDDISIDENGAYFDAAHVALYIEQYKKLPSNYITKAEAKALGWVGGSVEAFAPGKAIGGDSFSNAEGFLPKHQGRVYTECDIDTNGSQTRGAKRIVFSNDGLVYYTGDHYATFTLLYGNPIG